MTVSEKTEPQSQAGGEQDEQGEEIVIRANYELFILVLSALQVTNSVLIVLVRNDEAARIPTIINLGLWVLFIVDAFYRLWRTPNRRRFFFSFHGYLIFLGSLPVPFSGLFRLAWYRYVTLQLRRTDYHQMERVIVRKAAQSAMLVIMLIAIIVLEISSMAIIEVEPLSPDANILTADDAIWWSLVTMATVGYGDFYPVTVAGRFVALFVMVIGVGIFTVMTSFLAQFFIRPRRDQDEYNELGPERKPDDAQSSINAIKQLLDQQEEAHNAAMAEVRDKLNALEDQVLKARNRN